MTYEGFVIAFEPIVIYQEELDIANDAIVKLCPESYATMELGANLLNSYIKMLAKEIGDIGDWIGYYIWECDMGKNPHEVSYILNNGEEKVLHMTSLKDLYECITDNQVTGE